MKTTRKLLAMVLAVIMVMSLATTAFAAMEGTLTGGSITINDAVSGQDYSAYQILYLESYNAEAKTYVYKANSAWANWLKTCGYVTIDAQGYVTWVEGKSAADFAKAAQGQLEGKTPDKTATANGNTVTLDGLNLGYYLVDTTLGALCSLDTTNPNVVMEEKNEAPEAKKEVKEGEAWGETNDADIGDKVEFKATITVKAGAENYALYDTMSAGLSFNNDVVVTVGGQTVASSNYTVKTNVTGYTFVVEFKNEYIQTLAANTEIVITYSATLNENAVVAGSGNDNKIKLEYGDETDPSWTPDDTTITYTWEMPIFKYTGDDKTALAGAKFSLYTDEACENVVKLTDKGNNVYKVDPNGTVTEITTDASGKFEIEGLDSGIYYVKETEAPAGYNKLADAISVEITNEGKVKQNGEIVNQVEIENNSGTELPSTGGMGTTLFYVFGAILMVGAAVLLVTKRRMNMAE